MKKDQDHPFVVAYRLALKNLNEYVKETNLHADFGFNPLILHSLTKDVAVLSKAIKNSVTRG